MNKFFKAAAFAVTALLLAAPVFAQPAQLESNTSKATAGVFTSDVDDSMSVHDFSGVNESIEKWFGFVGYGGDWNDNPVSLGYATKLGGLYLGAWYTGNGIGSTESWNKSVTTNYDLATQLKTTTSTTTSYDTDRTYTNNQVEVLIGLANMGIKVGFWERLTSLSKPDYVTITVDKGQDGSSTYDYNIVEFSDLEGVLCPMLTWGMALELGSFVLKPKVEAAFGIVLHSGVNDSRGAYTTVNGKVLGTDTIYREGREEGFLVPDATISADFEFEKFTLGVSYGINLPLYSNSYSAAGFSGDVDGTVSWDGSTVTTVTDETTQTRNTLDLNITERSELTHRIGLSFYTDKEVAEGLTFGIYAGANAEISTKSRDDYYLDRITDKTVYNNTALSAQNTRTETEGRGFTNSYSDTTIEVTPFVNLGAQYVLVPGRLTVNAGIAITPTAYTNTVTRSSEQPGFVETIKEYDGNGNLINQTVQVILGDEITDSVNSDVTWDYLSASFNGGFVFNFSEKLALDTSFGYGPSDYFTANVTTLSVLLSLKF